MLTQRKLLLNYIGCHACQQLPRFPMKTQSGIETGTHSTRRELGVNHAEDIPQRGHQHSLKENPTNKQ